MNTPLIIDKECRNLYNLGSKIKWISEKEQGMAGKGRPTVDDKRDNQYRVRLNDEENQMLAYCSEKTGQPKSQIFRRALESYFQTVQLNELEMETDGISMKRVIKCPHCGASNAIDLADYSTGDYSSERQMGAEIQHCFDCEGYKCIGCGRCEAICTRGNISIQDHYPVFNRQACVACKACERICPQNAIKFVGESITSSEVMEILLRDRDYYLNSGGGVTFSGGEAFTQFEGLMDLLIQCKNEKLHTSVETCGQVNLDKIKQALPLIDLFLFDIKHTDKDLLQKETGANLDTVLTNLRYISSKSANKVTIRVPVIPGFNFNENTLREIFMLAKENRIKCVHLLPYHTLGKDKYEQLGLTYPYPCEQMLAKEELFPFKEMGEKMGLEIRIGG